MSVLEVSASTFQRDVLDRSRSVPVVVDFWAPWCGPCRTLGPILERLAAQSGGRWVLAKINTDDNQGLAQRYQIQGIPAVKAFRDGAVVDEFVGALPEPQVRAFLERIVPDEATLTAQEAARALQAGDTAGAAGLYAQALQADPSQPDAILFAAREAVGRGAKEEAQGLLARLRSRDRTARAAEVASLEFGLEAPPLAQARAAHEADPADPAARYGLGSALVAAGDHAAALELFLGLVRNHRTWGDDAGRKAMLRVFDIVGVRAPLSDEYRRKLSMELYK